MTSRKWHVIAFAIVGMIVTLIPPASAAPSCFGHAATKVGTRRDDRLRGTEGPDVIVGLAGRDTRSSASTV
jgi:hypothetical protein